MSSGMNSSVYLNGCPCHIVQNTNNKTAFRPNLDPNETLRSIVTVKMELQNGCPTRKYNFPPTVLSAGKKATMHYNNLHSSNSKKIQAFVKIKSTLHFDSCMMSLQLLKCH